MTIYGEKRDVRDRNTSEGGVSEKPEDSKDNNNCDNHVLFCSTSFGEIG